MFDSSTYIQLLASENDDMLWLAQVLQVAPRKNVNSKTL